MISNDQNKALLIVGNSALENASWKDYTDYCFAREKGLRKEAFKHLGNFLRSAEGWGMEEKIRFVKFLCPLLETVEEADFGPFPQPLSKELVEPTLREWCVTEQADGDPFRWYGIYYRSEPHIYRALAIDPYDDRARQTLIGWWTDNIDYSVHHLPEGYIGDCNSDLELCDKITEQISLLKDTAWQDHWTKKFEESLELVKNYNEWRDSGHPSFEQWGEKSKRRVNY